MIRKTAIGMMVAGALSAAIGWLWPAAARTMNPWTEQKARAHAEHAARLHRLGHERIHQEAEKQAGRNVETTEIEKALDEARLAYQSSANQLQIARGQPGPIARAAQWLGLLLMLTGAIGWLAGRNRS